MPERRTSSRRKIETLKETNISPTGPPTGQVSIKKITLLTDYILLDEMSNCESILKPDTDWKLDAGRGREAREKNDFLLGKPNRQGAKGVVRRNVISFVTCATC